MVAGSFTRDYLSPVAPSRIWKAGIFDSQNLLPKLLPDLIASVDILEGDGGAGTIKQYNAAEDVKEFRFIKERTDILDNENRIMKETVINGGFIGSLVKSYGFSFDLKEDSNGGTAGKVTVFYEALGDTPLTTEEEEKVIGPTHFMIKAIEQYLIANPTT
ncbi:Pathogenesis-related protein 1 [Apostasia shenzhenica]|uniref:Pathogenesis-related protein 1 n=1 Tax=Apostasia shenzhenica TaxID=1088818 RepID=A0A2I0B365_9ASPA|nr:Pathogenesis-related protein 1 [Apostasia shenzhenica]